MVIEIVLVTYFGKYIYRCFCLLRSLSERIIQSINVEIVYLFNLRRKRNFTLMQILSHRGYWLDASEKNTEKAFHRSFTLGFGTETDVRDSSGALVISHDTPRGNEMSFGAFLKIYKQYGDLPLALNIKSDGLQDLILYELQKNQISNYFLFDMSIPDAIRSFKKGLNCFARESEYEVVTPALLSNVSGVWFDYFDAHELNLKELNKFLVMDKKVCLVSPELHGKCEQTFWQQIISSGLHKNKNLMICTDKPEELKHIVSNPDGQLA